MKKKHFIFDLGGVLLRWRPKQVAQALQKKQPDFSEDLAEIVHTPIWHDFDCGIYSYEETIAIFSKQFSEEHVRAFFEAVRMSLVPIERGLAILKKIQAQGCKTYVLSNVGQVYFEFFRKSYAFFETFDGIVCSYQEKLMKPDERIYQRLLNRYHLKPQQCVFFDDRPVNIEAANRLGIQGVLFTEEEDMEKKIDLLKLIPQ